MSHLKSRHTDAGRRVNALVLCQGYGTPAVPTFEFYDSDGRRHLVNFDASRIDALIQQLTSTRATLERLAAS